jgi:hypothetical protein
MIKPNLLHSVSVGLRRATTVGALVWLLSSFAYGQGFVYQGSPVINAVGQPIAGASVAVSTANPCGTSPTYTNCSGSAQGIYVGSLPPASLATLYTDINVGTTTANPLTTDGFGNWSAYLAAAGNYWVTVSGPRITTQVFAFTIGSNGGGVPTGVANGSQLVSNGVSQPPVYQVKPQCHTADMAGADLGAKVAACISGPLNGILGEVRIDTGGTWSTCGVVIPSGIDVFLDSKAGNILNGCADRSPIALMSSSTSFQCESWSNTIQAPAGNNETILCGKDQGSGCSNTTAVISNVKVNGCHFVTQGAAGSPLVGAVWLENCVHCETNHNFFDGIKTIDIVIGASSAGGNRSQYYNASNNHLKGWTNAGIAVINGSQFDIGNNFFHAHGNGAAGDIDIEPNLSTDYAEDGDVHSNIVDATDNTANFVDYGITLQCAGYTHCKHLRIHDNLIWGGEPGATLGPLQQGVSVEGSYMQVYNNTVTNAQSSQAIGVAGDHSQVYNNQLFCSAILVFGINGGITANNNLIEGNTISTNGCAGGASTIEYNGRIIETINTFVANNVYRNNVGVTDYVLTNGTVINETQNDATGQTFHIPVGFPNGIAGGALVSQLPAPSGLTKGTAAPGGCNGGFTPGTYFYKVTATDVAGETTPSSEFSMAAGGVNGCAYLYWNKVTGAKCYNIYRSTTTNTEQFIAQVCGGVTTYPDVGGQTPTSSPPAINTTGALQMAPTTVGALPAAAAGNAGQMFEVTDSTAVASEGQTCVGGSTNKALAFSNGSVWKCF